MFLIRNDELFSEFPLSDSNCFNNNPYLLSSNSNKNIDLQQYIKILTLDLQENDLLILASDALSAWFMQENENNEKPWNILIGKFDCKKDEYQKKFSDWIEEQRILKNIKNDDIVNVIIEI